MLATLRVDARRLSDAGSASPVWLCEAVSDFLGRPRRRFFEELAETVVSTLGVGVADLGGRPALRLAGGGIDCDPSPSTD